MLEQIETSGRVNSLKVTSTEERSMHWEIDEKTLQTFAANPSKGIHSPSFGQGRWQLYLHEEDRLGPSCIQLCLRAQGDRTDARAATSENAWVRDGFWTVAFELFKGYGYTSQPLGFKTRHKFRSTNPTALVEIFGNHAAFASWVADKRSIRIHCALKNDGVDVTLQQRTEDKIGHLLFDNPRFADVVFTFPEELAGQRIFASQAVLEHRSEYFRDLFSSGFSEATQAVTVDIANLPRLDEAYIERDEDDMGVFDDEVDEHTMTNDDVKEEPREREEDEKPSSPATKPPLLRSMIGIKVTDTCFIAYRAMLAYLHSGFLPFTALPSDYLVARQEALAEHKAGSPTEPFTFDDRPKWLQDRFRLPNEIDWKGIRPCSPHVIYRLAHRYDMQDLLEVAQDRIHNGLSDENAAYELFSPLSITHNELLDGIKEYMAENWEEVRSTHAWETVRNMIVAGEMVHAAPAINEVFDLMEHYLSYRDE